MIDRDKLLLYIDSMIMEQRQKQNMLSHTGANQFTDPGAQHAAEAVQRTLEAIYTRALQGQFDADITKTTTD